jgi:hypothetical protein
MERINGEDVTVREIKSLKDVITENNILTKDQNEKLVRYTRWLLWLTVAIGLVAVMQVAIAIRTLQ